MTAPETEEIKQMLGVARELLIEAEDNVERHNLRSAITAAYYAVYHAARAALAARGVVTKTHKGLIQQFGQTLIQPKVLDAEQGRTLTDLHDDRQSADYLAVTESLEYDAARDNVNRARAFVEAIEKIIV